MSRLTRRRSWLILVLVATLVPAAVALPSGTPQRVYRIALSFPFPPWGVGPLEGVDFDLLTALCEANGPMQCRLEDRPASDCVDTDADGQMSVGPALASGAVDGCVATRRSANAWAPSSPTGTAAGPCHSSSRPTATRDSTASARRGASRARGSASSPGSSTTSTASPGSTRTSPRPSFASDQLGRDAMLADLGAGRLDLAFWDSTGTVPPGTHLVGEPVAGCGPLLSVITFPPSASRPHHSDALRRDFNCGLALIRMSGEMAEICAASTHPGGDPTCVLEGPPPTVQCLADNPGALAPRRRGPR